MPLNVDTADVGAVHCRVAEDYRGVFPAGDLEFVGRVVPMVVDCFEGRHPEYQAIDARYHDLEHTLQGTLCFTTLLRRRSLADERPVLSEETFQLGLLAILLHDTGYLKRREDTEGTGAKYTSTHVHRSCDFAGRLLEPQGYSAQKIHSIQNMIRCTGLGVNVSGFGFPNDEERIAGFALGTADLLGQMAADDYLDKLPILFMEFAEAAAYNASHGMAGSGQVFASVDDLVRRTPGFWANYVLPKIQKDFQGLHRFLADPLDGRNEYLHRIEANLERLRIRLASPE